MTEKTPSAELPLPFDYSDGKYKTQEPETG
jgi:hypothetical protein